MKLRWTKRGARRLLESIRYIGENFHPDYAAAFSADAINTANKLLANPDIGLVAFPEIGRPEIRKILLSNRHFWMYYRRRRTICEILSIRHTLMAIGDPAQL